MAPSLLELKREVMATAPVKASFVGSMASGVRKCLCGSVGFSLGFVAFRVSGGSSVFDGWGLERVIWVYSACLRYSYSS